MFTRTVKCTRCQGGMRENLTLPESVSSVATNLDSSALTVFVRVKGVSDILAPCYLTKSQESQPNAILETRLS